jgi:dihydrofolate reductase
VRTLTYYVAASLDGFIAAPDGTADLFPWSAGLVEYANTRMPETVPTAYRAAAGLDGAANRRFDTVLMGRRTYEAAGPDTPSPWRHLRQYVVSRTLAADPHPEVALLAGDPVAGVRRLKRAPGLGLWLSGGGALAGALLPEIDELIVKRYPVALGAGIPLFGTASAPHRFTLASSRAFDGGVVMDTYTADRPGAEG